MNDFECSLNEARELVEIIIKTNTAVMLTAPPGVGKSSMVFQIAKKMGIDVLDIRLAQHDPIDLKGIPNISTDNRGNEVTKWLIPDFLPKSGEGILFLDELTCAAPAVQNAALQLVLDRKLNDYVLPPGWKIVAAGNTAEHGAFVSRLSNPMKNRMAHINITPYWSEVKEYFIENAIRNEVVSFLDWRPELLFNMPKTEESAFPTPRTWEKFSEILNVAYGAETKINGGKSLKLANTIIGQGAAIEFSSFIDIYVNIKPGEIIDDGKIPTYNDSEIAVKFASCGAVSQYFLEKKSLKENHIKNFIAFVENLEPEFQVKVMKNMNWLKNKKHYKACLDHASESFHRLNANLTKVII